MNYRPNREEYTISLPLCAVSVSYTTLTSWETHGFPIPSSTGNRQVSRPLPTVNGVSAICILHNELLLLSFFMSRALFTPIAILLELDFLGHQLLIFARPIIRAAALRTGEFDELVLGHTARI